MLALLWERGQTRVSRMEVLSSQNRDGEPRSLGEEEYKELGANLISQVTWPYFGSITPHSAKLFRYINFNSHIRLLQNMHWKISCQSNVLE
jgi:hypothetical protein